MGASGIAGGHSLPHLISLVARSHVSLVSNLSDVSSPSRSVPVTIAVPWWFPALLSLSSRERAVIVRVDMMM